jgi:periplasmic protein TonB
LSYVIIIKTLSFLNKKTKAMMNTNKQETMKMVDIIFAHRNKDYGAYAIRIGYGNTVIKSMLLASGLFLIFTFAAFKLTKMDPTPKEKIIPSFKFDDSTKVYIVTIKPDEVKPDQPKQNDNVNPPKAAKTDVSQVGQLIRDSAINRRVLIDSSFKETKIDSDIKTTGNIGQPLSNLNQGKPGEPSSSGNGGENSNPGPTFGPEIMPEFPGGNEKILSFINKNIIYPEQARLDRTQQKFHIQFVVDENGNVIAPKVMEKNVDENLAAEAKRVLTLMPRWKPGMINNRNVKVYFTVPFQFKLGN